MVKRNTKQQKREEKKANKKHEKKEKKELKKVKKEAKKEAKKSQVEPKKADNKLHQLQKEIEGMKNQLKSRDEKFQLFDSLLTGLDSVSQIYQGLSEAQQQKLTSKGVDLESGQKNLKEILFRDANAYVEELKAKVREEFLANQRELERERDVLIEGIERQRNTMNELGLLDEADIEKSLAPLQSKLKSKLEELERNEATIKTLTNYNEEKQEGQSA